MKFSKMILLAAVVVACSQSKQEAEHGHSHGEGEDHHHHHDVVNEEFTVVTDTLPKTTVAATAASPEFIQLATGIEVIPDITKSVDEVGVMTHEGIFGPLLFAEKVRAFFIELKPGMFLAEHPHPTESIVYTVSGKWVLCSEEKRQVMETGSLFHFGSNRPTGWEAPFEGGALLLIVKSKEEGADFGPYVEGLKNMAATLDEEMKNGVEFYYNQLPENHVAIEFARSVNPNFDKVLEGMSN